MTKVEAIEKSITMWKHIKDNRLKSKGEYFSILDNNRPYADCYLCEYCKSNIYFSDCDKCINWDKNNNQNSQIHCIFNKSPYYEYYMSVTRYTSKRVYAYEIAEDMLKVLRRELGKELKCFECYDNCLNCEHYEYFNKNIKEKFI